VPVDQAFEILIQKFGGMEKASEEFNKNPELLSSVSSSTIFTHLYFWKKFHMLLYFADFDT
jgi:hypothetical protein